MLIILTSVGLGLVLVFVLLYALIHKSRENEHLKYEFITIIAHKFRTPLTSIKWASDNLSKEETDAYKKEALGQISEANDSLIKLTTTLIELTDTAEVSKTTYTMERVNVCELVHAAIEHAKNAFHEKNQFVGMTCSNPVIFVNADRDRMNFVLETFLDNACIYTSPGKDIGVNIVANDKAVTIAVTDHGIGMTKGEMARMFSKFYRSKEAQTSYTEGVGVGLYLAHSIVKRHNGRVDAMSDGPGLGSTFSVTLPTVK